MKERETLNSSYQQSTSGKSDYTLALNICGLKIKANAEELQFLEWPLEVGSKNKSIPKRALVKMPLLHKLTLKKESQKCHHVSFYSRIHRNWHFNGGRAYFELVTIYSLRATHREHHKDRGDRLWMYKKNETVIFRRLPPDIVTVSGENTLCVHLGQTDACTPLSNQSLWINSVLGDQILFLRLSNPPQNARSNSVNGVKVSDYLPVSVASKVHVVEAVRLFLTSHMQNLVDTQRKSFLWRQCGQICCKSVRLCVMKYNV